MPQLAQLIRVEIAAFLLALASLVAIQLLTGEINTVGLLHGRRTGREKGKDQYFSPERVQLLILTLSAGFYYVSQVLANPHPGTFPSIPEGWPAIMGGSNAVYLGGKAYARWLANGKHE